MTQGARVTPWVYMVVIQQEILKDIGVWVLGLKK